MSEYDDWDFYSDENEEFQRELPEILKDGFANRKRPRRREPDYLSLYVNDFTPKELLTKTKADRERRLAWFERELQEERARIAELSPTEKLLEAVNRGARQLPSEVAEEIKAIFTPATIATMMGVFAVYMAASLTGFSQGLTIGMGIAGILFFGLDVVAIFGDLAGFGGAVNANTEQDLDEAGEHLASLVAMVGVDAILTLLSGKIAQKIGKSLDNFIVPDELIGLNTAEFKRLSKIATKEGIDPDSIVTLYDDVGLKNTKEILQQSDSEIAAALRSVELEKVDGGHSIKRHGPQIKDDVLEERVTTGYAADGVFSPTPASTRFLNYETWEKTRGLALKEIEKVKGIDLN